MNYSTLIYIFYTIFLKSEIRKYFTVKYFVEFLNYVGGTEWFMSGKPAYI